MIRRPLATIALTIVDERSSLVKVASVSIGYDPAAFPERLNVTTSSGAELEAKYHADLTPIPRLSHACFIALHGSDSYKHGIAGRR
jgi:hypothetical protein